jgi:hypothetical protein
MSRFIFTICLSFTSWRAIWTDQPPRHDPVPLIKAVNAFNAKASREPIGQDQSPLTEAEVLAAIRYWKRPKESPVSDELHDAFKRIAETRMLPANADFEFLTGYDPGGAFVFDVWSVRIRMSRPDGSSYAFVIRERLVCSRTLEEELRLAEERVQKTPPLPGAYRVKERVENLKARIAKTKVK